MTDKTTNASNVTTIQQREREIRAGKFRKPAPTPEGATIDLMAVLEESLAKSGSFHNTDAGRARPDIASAMDRLARAQTQVVAETLQADGDLGPESASERIRDALQILSKPDDEIDELDLAAVRERLRAAVEQLEADVIL